MKFFFIFLALMGALVVLHFVFSIISLWAIVFGIVGFFVGYSMSHGEKT